MAKFILLSMVFVTLTFGANLDKQNPTASFKEWSEFIKYKDADFVSVSCAGEKYIIRASDQKEYCVFPSFSCLREPLKLKGMKDDQPVFEYTGSGIGAFFKIACETSACANMEDCWKGSVPEKIAKELSQKVGVDPVTGEVKATRGLKPQGEGSWINKGEQGMENKGGTTK